MCRRLALQLPEPFAGASAVSVLLGRTTLITLRTRCSGTSERKRHIVANPNYWRNEMLVPLEMYERNPTLYEGFSPPVERQLLFEPREGNEKARK